MAYDTWEADPGVYKHHEGKAKRSPTGYTWIKEIRIAWGLVDDGDPLKDFTITCPASGCENTSITHRFDGCHLRVSWTNEVLKHIFGLGGTPVIALCATCHNKYGGSIRLGSMGMGVIDENAPLDWNGPTTQLDANKHIECKHCRKLDTVGPDEENEWFCSTCGHHIDENGSCATDSCEHDDGGDDESIGGWAPPPGMSRCTCSSNCEFHLRSRCKLPPNSLCFNQMCGQCCDGEMCLRHSDHEKFGRPAWKKLAILSKKTADIGLRRYQRQKEFLEKKFRYGPLRTANPICRSCNNILDTSDDRNWRCADTDCPEYRSKVVWCHCGNKSSIGCDYNKCGNCCQGCSVHYEPTDDDGGYDSGRKLGFHARCSVCDYIAVGSDISESFGWTNRRPRARCKNCRKSKRHS